MADNTKANNSYEFYHGLKKGEALTVRGCKGGKVAGTRLVITRLVECHLTKMLVMNDKRRLSFKHDLKLGNRSGSQSEVLLSSLIHL